MRPMNPVYKLLGYVIGRVCRYRSRISLQNMARAFPTASYAEISGYQLAFYRNLGRIIFENLFPFYNDLRIEEASLEKLKKTSSQNRCIILMMGHYGNWEVLNRLPLRIEIPVQALYKPIKNKILDRIVKKSRSRYGMRLIPSQKAVRTLIDEKDNPTITLFIADQFPGSGRGLPIDFLHQKTQMFTGAEQLARRLNAFVAYIELKPLAPHSWQMSLQTVCEDATETTEGFITTTYTRKLEQSIRGEPSWWLWTHRRWK